MVENSMSWKKLKFDSNSRGPLSGLRVLDLTRLVAGNITSLQLADYGADVIKVEPLPDGDPLRAWGVKNIQTFWKVYSRNKRSIGLDFHERGSIELLERLIAKADILIENFRPGTMEKMGLDPTRLVHDYSSLIVLRISGFGQTGPYSSRPGFGTVVEAMSGFAARNGEEGGEPLLPPLALSDMIAGVYGAFGVMTALHERNNSGRGQVIDLSLLESIVSVLGTEPADLRLTGQPKPRAGNGSNTSSPRNVYRTRDGKHIALSASIQRMAERVFRLIGREDMIDDPRFRYNADRVENRDEVDRIIGDWMIDKSCSEVMELFEKEGVTAAPILDASDITTNPHFLGREVYVELPDEDIGSIPMHTPLPRLLSTPGTFRIAAPRLGQHNHEILDEFGIKEDEIDGYLKNGLVGEGSPA